MDESSGQPPDTSVEAMENQDQEDSSLETGDEDADGEDDYTLVTGGSRKRRNPRGGHSPENRHPPAQNATTPDNPGHQVRNPTSFRVNDTQNVEPNNSFIVRASGVIDLGQITSVVGNILPNSSIVRHHLSKNGKIAFFTTQPKSPDPDPQYDIKRMLQADIPKIIHDEYGDRNIVFSVHYHDPAVKRNSLNNPLSKHVIATQVPTSYSEEYFLSEIKNAIPEIGDKIQTCHRITSRQSKKPTPLMRIICSDEVTAFNLLHRGLKVGPIMYRCEEPHNNRPVPADRCFRCQKTDHFIKTCKSKDVCGKCSEAHRTSDCTKDREKYKCPNCGENHAVWHSKCKNFVPKVTSQPMLEIDPYTSAQAVFQPGPSRGAVTTKNVTSMPPIQVQNQQISANSAWNKAPTLPVVPPVLTPRASLAPMTPAPVKNTDLEDLRQDIAASIVEMNTKFEQLSTKLMDAIANMTTSMTEKIESKFEEHDKLTKELETEVKNQLRTECNKWTKEMNSVKTKIDNDLHYLTMNLTKQDLHVEKLRKVAEELPGKASKQIGITVRENLKKAKLMSRLNRNQEPTQQNQNHGPAITFDARRMPDSSQTYIGELFKGAKQPQRAGPARKAARSERGDSNRELENNGTEPPPNDPAA